MSEEENEIEVTIEKDILDAFRRKSIGEIVPEIAKMTTIMITVKLAMDVLAKLTEALKRNE
jgi:hypothetical protein